MPRNECALRGLTLGLILAFVACGIWGHRRAHCFQTYRTGPLCSSDRVFLDAFGVNDAPERIIASLEAIPPALPLALLAPKDDKLGPIMQMMVSSITWPRRVLLLPVEDGRVGKAIRASNESAFGAFLFFGITPPPAYPNQVHLGPLTIIRNAS